MSVVHIKKSKFDVFIGRPSKWGNPFVIGKDGTREQVIAKYREWLYQQPALLADLPSLKGKVLGCFCAPAPCHGDILHELANFEPQQDPEEFDIDPEAEEIDASPYCMCGANHGMEEIDWNECDYCGKQLT